MGNSSMTPDGDMRSLQFQQAQAERWAGEIRECWSKRGYKVKVKAVPQYGPSDMHNGWAIVSTLINGWPGPLKDLPDRVISELTTEIDDRRSRKVERRQRAIQNRDAALIAMNVDAGFIPASEEAA